VKPKLCSPVHVVQGVEVANQLLVCHSLAIVVQPVGKASADIRVALPEASEELVAGPTDEPPSMVVRWATQHGRCSSKGK